MLHTPEYSAEALYDISDIIHQMVRSETVDSQAIGYLDNLYRCFTKLPANAPVVYAPNIKRTVCGKHVILYTVSGSEHKIDIVRVINFEQEELHFAHRKTEPKE